MQIAITALGTANPRFKRPQMETAELIIKSLNMTALEKRILRSVYKSTGIKYRHSVLSDYCNVPGEFDFFPNDANAEFPKTAARMKIYQENALDLAIEAIEECFNTPNCISKREVTHLITVSCTGMYAPGLDIEIVQKLGLPSTVNRTAINFMGCYAAFNAMKVAEGICKSNPEAKVIIVCVELCTIHFQKNFSVTHLLSNAIFADGAAALIMENTPLNKKCLSLETFYCDLLPQTSQEMAWTIGDSGFDIVLSTYVPQAIESGIASFFKNLLSTQNLLTQDIDIYAIHPGGLKILQACETALQITPEDNHHSYQVLENFGNMSSATVLFVLKNIWQTVVPADQDKRIFSCAFGPGLTLESGIFKVNVS